MFLPNQQIFLCYIVFLIGKMSTRAGWNGFAGRIWPAGRSLVTPALDKLLFQICVVVIHFVKVNTRNFLQFTLVMKCRLLYISASLTPFSWGSQRKRLIYVDATFVSVVAPMLYTLSLFTRFIPTKPMAVAQLHFSMNRWIPLFRTANDNICLFYKWP